MILQGVIPFEIGKDQKISGYILISTFLVALLFLGEIDMRSLSRFDTGIVFTTAVQAYYLLSNQYNESGALTMIDITADGMGFILSFIDLV
ncbi:hypothetical protein N7509_006146 [Penicillium cosmopolitanum]|uniref:Uncharacterized protein n=1 Tax=Penicillium cosmopolitanum TaxID=1131564 RepID=A0A9W9W3K6_9EURO|nr:uncharacterized protein N7509_006146 [Penicillium cosmopolitanum]KAJ5398033.1 hypothetical protein N7509_006146 [Penicillium cosmopolitanum]